MTKNEFESRLDNIRRELFEKTKVLTNSDAAAAINDSGRKIAEKYGIAISKSEPVLPKAIS